MGKKHLTGLAALAAMAVASCAPKPTPGEVCSSQATFDQITRILSEAIISGTDQSMRAVQINPQAHAASSPTALGRVISYLLPVVEAVDKDTQKISCGAVLKLKIATLEQQGVDLSKLKLNEAAADHLSIQISYSVQPSADSKQTVVTLQDANLIAPPVFYATMAADPGVRDYLRSIEKTAEPDEDETDDTIENGNDPESILPGDNEGSGDD